MSGSRTMALLVGAAFACAGSADARTTIGPYLILDDATAVVETYEVGGTAPDCFSREVTNWGGLLSHLAYSVSTTSPIVPWLEIDPAFGDLYWGDSDEINVCFVPAELDLLAPGLHMTTLRFQNDFDAENFVDVSVIVSVDLPAAVMTVSSTVDITREYKIGHDLPASLMLNVSNTGPLDSQLVWSLQEVEEVPWLFTGPNNTGILGSAEGYDIDIDFAVAGLAPGPYDTVLHFKNENDGSEILVNVMLDVILPPVGVLSLDSADSINQQYKIGHDLPPTWTRTVTNTGGECSILNWSLTEVDEVPWLFSGPMNGGTLLDAESKQVNIDFSVAGLTEGIYTTVLHFKNEDNGIETLVDVTLEVVLPPIGVLSLDDASAINQEYKIGDPALPPTWMRTVTNTGDECSILNWTLTEVDPVPWLYTGQFNAGTLLQNESHEIAIDFSVAGLTEGLYTTVLHFKNEDDGTEIQVEVNLDIIRPIALLCLEGDITELEIPYTIGDPNPADFPIAVSNCGDPLAALSFGITPSEPVAWLDFTPSSGIIPMNGGPQDVNLMFLPPGLVDDTYEVTLRFQNLIEPLDFKDVLVRLVVGNIGFTPGDIIKGDITGLDESHELDFLGIKGMKLRVNVKSPDKGLSVQLTVLDEVGSTVISRKIRPTKRGIRKVFTLRSSGLFKLRIEPLKGSNGSFDIATNRGLPKRAKRFKLSGSGGTDDVLPVKVRALPGATLDLRAVPSNFPGPLVLVVANPEGGVFDASGFATSLANGGMKLVDVPLDMIGAWVFNLSGFNSNPRRMADVLVKPIQPPLGSSTIVLP